ncbi:hypothetical protein, partial [Elizabethkingia meningoseptica]|uniref:hypothetical protein n=1 Tax=Elizabethkingia meningoseptica TaxID=238 RepID=UPI00148276DF
VVLLTRESRSPPVFIFEKPLHVNAEAFSFGTGTNITNLPAITTTLRMKSYGVIKVMEAEKLIEVIKEKTLTLSSITNS